MSRNYVWLLRVPEGEELFEGNLKPLKYLYPDQTWQLDSTTQAYGEMPKYRGGRFLISCSNFASKRACSRGLKTVFVHR